MIVRPRQFELDPRNPLSRNLVFAGLGNLPFTKRMWDTSIRRNHGTLTNMTPSTDWVFVPELGRWGLNFSASTDRYVTTTAYPLAGTSGQTLCAWVKRTGSGRYNIIGGGGTKAGQEFILQMNAGNVYSNNYTYYREFTSSCNDDAWHHVAIVMPEGTAAASGIIGYGDGKELAQAGVNDGVLNIGTTNQYYIATMKRYAPSLNWPGWISDAMVYHRALTPNEIADLADPSNVYLSGLIAGRPRTTYFLMGDTPSPLTPSFKLWFARNNNIVL